MNESKKIITRKITEKQEDFLDFIEKEMPYGKCLLIIHAGEPQRVEDVKPTKIFKSKGRIIKS
jgi:hypothetical protein